MRKLSFVRKVQLGLLTAVGVAALSAPAFAEEPPTVTEIMDTAQATITALGVLATAAFSIAVGPWAGKTAMASINSVFSRM